MPGVSSQLFTHRLHLEPSAKINPRDLPAGGGVYLISDAEDQPILLASAENLRRAVACRLASTEAGSASKRADLSEIARQVGWRRTFGRFETAWLHWRIAREMYPTRYRKMIGFGPTWFLRVDPKHAYPCFASARELGNVRCLGPFAVRRHAEEWIRMLEDVFDLCRYDHILKQAPHGEPCAYADMGRCPAPCNATISMNAYREMIDHAIDFSLGNREPRLAQLKKAMHSAAAERRFEQAASIRQTLDRANATVAKPEYKHLTDLAAAGWLIIQRGGPVSRDPEKLLIKPFHVRAGGVRVGAPTPLAGIESAAVTWIGDCKRRPLDSMPRAGEIAARSEVFWLLAKFLFQEGNAPGLFYRSDRLPSPEALAADARKRFGHADSPAEPPASERD